MRITSRYSGVAAAAAALFAAAVMLAGCSPTPVDNGADGSDVDDGATITLSTAPGELLVIEEHEGLGSTRVYGEFSAFDSEPTITGFDVDAGDELLVVSLDEDGRPVEVTLGSTMLRMQHNVDGSFDYQVYEFGALVWEGSNVSLGLGTPKTSHAKWTPVTVLNVVDCTVNQVTEWASLAIVRYQPAPAGGSVATHPFTDCLKNNNAIWDLARTSCILVQCVQERLNKAMELRGAAKAHAVSRVLNLVFGVLPFTLIGIESAAADIAEQVWADPACRSGEDRPGCTDTCQYAFDDVCDDGGPGSQYSVCEQGTDCSDCGPREPADDSDTDTPAATCGDGICDSAAGEMTSCPEDCPNNCGDEICNLTAGELLSCPQDCPEEQCCIDANGCPSEGLYDCPGDCCCCSYGARCVRSDNVWVCGI